jgi:YHS domain-containing protein
MLRDLLLLVLMMLVARAMWRILGGILQGIVQTGSQGAAPPHGRRSAPVQGVHMVRDPVCGVFVVPDRALALTHGSGQVYFCSSECRDKYRARPSGRTA